MPRTDHYPLQVRIPLEMHERLLTQSAAESRSIRTIVTRAIEAELAECESSQKRPKPGKKTRAA